MNNLKTALIATTLVFLFSHLGIAGEAKVKIKGKPGQLVSADPAANDGKINADFPEPTDIRDIARAFSLWTGTEYIVDDSVQAKVRLNSPERVTKDEALKRFHRMLASNGLHTVKDSKGGFLVVSLGSKR